MGRVWNRVSFIAGFVLWATSVHCKVQVKNCATGQYEIIPGGLCDAAEDDSDYDFNNVVFPTPSCDLYDAIEIQEMSFTVDGAKGVDIATGGDVRLHCEANVNTKIKGLTFTMWLCRRSSMTLEQCLCPTTARRGRGAIYTIAYNSSKSLTTLSLDYTITNATHNSTDHYYCLVQVGIGRTVSGFVDVDINVRDTNTPEITKGPKNVSSTVGAAVSLSCEATGFPEVSYKWVKDGDLLNDKNRTRLSIISNTSMSIFQINMTSQEDEGIYACVAVNSLGNETSEGAVLKIENSMPSQTPVTGRETLALPIGIGGSAAVVIVALFSVVMGFVVRKRGARAKNQRQREREAQTTINQNVEANNFIIHVEGDGAQINITGDITLGGKTLGDKVVDSTDNEVAGDPTDHGGDQYGGPNQNDEQETLNEMIPASDARDDVSSDAGDVERPGDDTLAEEKKRRSSKNDPKEEKNMKTVDESTPLMNIDNR
ncbi:uncharacterized protein [Ptychodera flava]|uniref:uncharacterized protein n=1 Tax=Ptychodera flava TaxID=63121 RepID=UPI00396A80C8